jgi:branched-chain amino acid transport system substrate-binding protein
MPKISEISEEKAMCTGTSLLTAFKLMSWRLALVGTCLHMHAALAQTPGADDSALKPPVWIGFDDAFGQKTNTSAMSIEWGIKAAMEDINAAGGVLDGRPLKLVTTDNKGVTAIGKDNFIELAATKDLVAILGGKFSPIVIEMVPEAQRLKIPLISVWGSADAITDHQEKPSYTFRVSLKDEWGVQAMMKRLSVKYKVRKACAILPNTEWGRSTERVLKKKAAQEKIQFPAVLWYNWGDASLKTHYDACLDAQSEGLLLVANEKEAAVLIKEVAGRPKHQRLPIISHWGAVGGTLHELAKDELSSVQIDFIQTFTFINNKRPRALALSNWILKNTNLKDSSDIPSPVGAAHAYDTVYLLANAIKINKTIDPQKIRDGLEKLPAFDGAVRQYSKPFSESRHDALDRSQVLFVKLTPAGRLIPQD